jgi:hypothetical protein
MSLIKNRIGESRIANNGQLMTIIAYRERADIDVQFEDGTIVYERSYQMFQKGSIRNPNFKRPRHIGETRNANNGQLMTIIAYRDCYDIDVMFEDGAIVRNKAYSNFKTGSIKNGV